ncbi:SRPBCC family protein [Streptomyces sp. NPDC001941]|uniref:SRPBCC family protein n=1 Tax=Streptomyces sp. NPDC001941 TaxID=3154659 RepID=UPI00331E5044
MIRFVRVLDVERSLPQVAAYLADFTHAERWDPGIRACRRLGFGPVGEGSRWRSTTRLRGRTAHLTYVLVHSEPDRLVFAGHNEVVSTVSDLRLEAVDGGTTRITYAATVRLRGAARLTEPLLARDVRQLGDQITYTLPTALLIALPSPAAAAPLGTLPRRR